MTNGTLDGPRNLVIYSKTNRISLSISSGFNCVTGVLSFVSSFQFHSVSNATSLTTFILSIVSYLAGPVLYLMTGILGVTLCYKQTKGLVISTVILSSFCAYFASLKSVVSLASIHLECSGAEESFFSCFASYVSHPLIDLAALIINLVVSLLIVTALMRSRTKMFFLVAELMEGRLAKTWEIEKSRDQRKQTQSQEECPPSYSMITMT